MRVSVITANYNCGKYLKECIASVRSQKYRDYEHLILNDCSRDGSDKILRRAANRDNHLKVINVGKRLYCGSAYLELCKHVTGDIVGVLDADDALASKAIKNLVSLYHNNPSVGYIWTQFWLCDANLKKIKKGFSSHPGAQSLLEAGRRGRHCFSHWRTFRRSVLERGDIFPAGLKSAVDKYMGYALEELAVGGFTKQVLYKYRQRAGGLSYTGRKNWKKMKITFFEKRANERTTVFPVKQL